MMEIVKGKIGNAITSTASDHVVAVAHDIYDEQQERYQDDINNYLLEHEYGINNVMSCFGSGVWDNDLCWSNVALWDNNKYAVTEDLQNQIDQLESAHNEDVRILTERISSDEQHQKALNDSFRDSFKQNNQEHNAINQILLNHTERIEELEVLIDEHDQQITNLLDTLSCFSAGQWDNGLKWSNAALWENSNLMCDTFEDIYRQIDNHQSAIDDLRKQIQQVKTDAEKTLNSINQTFDNFRKEHEGFRQEHQTFSDEHNSFRTEHQGFNKRFDGLDSLCEEQQREIDTLLHRVSILTNGKWDNTLLWINDSEWLNTDFNGSCHCPADTEERLDELQEGLTDLTQRIATDEQTISECQTGIAEVADIAESNTLDIANNANEIENIKQNAIKEHRDVAYQLRAIGREQKAQDENVAKIGNHFSCYADGIWGDLFVWDNELLWANKSGVITEALEDIRTDISSTKQKLNDANEDIMTNLSLIQANHQLIESNIEDIQENKSAIQDTQSKLDAAVKEIQDNALTEHRSVAYQLRAIGREQVAQDENIAKLGEHFGCFVDGQWGDLFLWHNDHLWNNNVGVVTETLSEVKSEVTTHDDRIAALEAQFALFAQQYSIQQAIIEQQRQQIETLMDCFTVLNVGKWQNLLLWDNTSKWSDSLITEVSADGGTASVAVKSYDPETSTVSI